MLNIIVIGTNAYSPLALRLMNRWREFYLGHEPYTFWYFGDVDPKKYGVDAQWVKTYHKNWKAGTNSKFAAVAKVSAKLKKKEEHWIYYLDADTHVSRVFSTDPWLVDGLGVCKHWINGRNTPKEKLPFDRHRFSRCFVPLDQPRQVYYYGAFWGGSREHVLAMTSECDTRMQADLAGGYDAAVNDESYTNWYFNQNPKLLKLELEANQFPFLVSCKGGLEHTRDPHKDIAPLLKEIAALGGAPFNIVQGKVVPE